MLKARPPSGSRIVGPAHSHECSKVAFSSLAAADCTGDTFSFGQLAGKVTIVINVSDSHNETPQNINNFKEMIQLYNECHQRGLEIVAFPSEQFGGQQTCKVRNTSAWRDRMGIRFHVMQNVDVNGSHQHPVYTFLKQQSSDIRGHFQTAFVVACGEERCSIHRFDGKPPRALRSRVEEFLGDVVE